MQEPGSATGNVPFKGEKFNEDFGLEDITGRNVDRYKFRTSPLRNVSLQPTFGHDGTWTKLEDVVRHHLNPVESGRKYDPAAAGVAADLRKNTGPIEPVLKRLSPLLAQPIVLTQSEFDDLIAFLRDGLLDPRTSRRRCARRSRKRSLAVELSTSSRDVSNVSHIRGKRAMRLFAR